ncbi:MerR family transcriptional regulator [Caldicellulosiruptor sp. DIB 104C]|uniref:MerR family transcriptional regulator n=1 Tax=Caldicellulosiruptor sp. DIB 104C TaxID=3019889 RepID=UPI00230540D8|nr:MerR family transcriptional regulator [Caldicellulosiruptor sp. DIB 104C]
MTITEVSKKYGISTHALRYYERIGLIPKAKRNENGIRYYTEEDCRWIEFILCMRKAGVEIETLLEYVNLLHRGDETIEQRRQLLIKQRDKLILRMEEIKKALEKLNYKIKDYESKIVPVEKDLMKLNFNRSLMD